MNRNKSIELEQKPTHQEQVASDLIKLINESELSPKQALSLAEIQIKLGLLDMAEQNLSSASLLSATSAYVNGQACLLLAKAADGTPGEAKVHRHEAIELLKSLTQTHPDLSAGWFNLAGAYDAEARSLRVNGEDDTAAAANAVEAWGQFLDTDLTEPQRQIGEARRKATGK